MMRPTQESLRFRPSSRITLDFHSLSGRSAILGLKGGPMSLLTAADSQRELGAFYTRGNPFIFEPFKNWFRQVDSKKPILEPFAGTRQIAFLIEDAGFTADWKFFDIDPSLGEVETRDTIADFPKGFEAVITNPPYLSFHFAKRKGLDLEKSLFRGYQSLYQTSIELALGSCDYVAMIIPESFITSGLFTERLQSVISLPFEMFSDTDMPTCLALWGPGENSDFEVWRQSEYLGKFQDLVGVLASTPCSNRIRFNDPQGNLGFRAIDDSVSPSIYFCAPEEIPLEKVKVTARLLTRVFVHGVEDLEGLTHQVNSLISDWRLQTQDVALTAFKGMRKDGVFRRRLDYANARALLSQAICRFEDHEHTLWGDK